MTTARLHGESELAHRNRSFYDPLWTASRLTPPERFNTWPLVASLLSPSQSRLEVAPGLRPRLPIAGTHFVDASAPAVAKLLAGGADAIVGDISALPFDASVFALVASFDILEHVEDDDAALRELARVAADGAILLLSAPLHPSRWTSFDELVGHRRRYEPAEIVSKLDQSGWRVERSAAFGMQPQPSRLLDFGVWGLTHRREKAMWWYDRVMLPLAAWFQKDLMLTPGMMVADDVDEVLLVCSRAA